MNNWIILGIIVGLLVVGGIAIVSALSTSQQSEVTSTRTGCGSCSGTCTAKNNCGASTCGATNGGACTCGRR